MTLVLNGYRWSSSLHADAQMEADIDEGREAKADAAAALGVQAQNLQTVLQHNPDMAARTRDGIDVLGFATELESVDFVDQLHAHGATVNAGALPSAVQSLFVDMVRKLSLGHAYLVGPDLLMQACVVQRAMPIKLEMVRYLMRSIRPGIATSITAYFFWTARWRRTASAELPTDDTAERRSSTVQLRLLVQYLTS